MKKEDKAPEKEPEKPCTCALEDGRCPACWGLLSKAVELYQKATLEFFGRIEWIAASMRPPCKPCIQAHADDLAEKVVVEVFSKLDRPQREEMWTKLVVTLLHQGVTSFPKTAAAYRRLNELNMGNLHSIDELLKALYGRA